MKRPDTMFMSTGAAVKTEIHLKQTVQSGIFSAKNDKEMHRIYGY